MNYRHLYHAGNFADVVKHVALTAILLHLRKKESPFAVIDSHAGRGLYDLSSEEARKTGEAQSGIAALSGLNGEMPEALRLYLDHAGDPQRYPGSPLLAARLLRPQDRLVAIEKHPEDEAALRQALAPYARARAEIGDGYDRLAALLPPPERRGLVLVDPPFEVADEFDSLAVAVRAGLRRFATGIYLIWYPVKSPGAAAFCGEVLAQGVVKALRIEIAVDAPDGKLSRAALLVLNPPFGLDATMNAVLTLLAPRLKGRGQVEWLNGG